MIRIARSGRIPRPQRSKLATTIVIFVVAVLTGYRAPQVIGAQDARATATSIAMLAGTGGNITTLGCYDPNPFVAHPIWSGKPNPWATCRTTDDSPPDGYTGPHSGATAPTDIGGGNGSTTVWVQNDYLPSAVRGGYLWAEDATSACYNASTSGARTKVWIYYYDNVGYTDVHAAYYGHVDQNTGVMNAWKLWNNYYATSPLWAAWTRDYDLNNTTSGGMPIGVVRPNPTGCVTGAHLHQDMDSAHSESYNAWNYSEGCWFVSSAPAQAPCTLAGYTWVPGKPTTGRFTDIHYLYINLH